VNNRISPTSHMRGVTSPPSRTLVTFLAVGVLFCLVQFTFFSFRARVHFLTEVPGRPKSPVHPNWSLPFLKTGSGVNKPQLGAVEFRFVASAKKPLVFQAGGVVSPVCPIPYRPKKLQLSGLFLSFLTGPYQCGSFSGHLRTSPLTPLLGSSKGVDCSNGPWRFKPILLRPLTLGSGGGPCFL